MTSDSRRTACLNVWWPSMRTRRSSRRTTIDSAPEVSQPSTIGPIAPGRSPARTTAAPAPSPNSAAVQRSSGSASRVMISAPITTAVVARPDSIIPAATHSAETQPVQAAPTSIAAASCAPRRPATSGAVLGTWSSALDVATSTRSTAAGLDPGARERAARRGTPRGPRPARPPRRRGARGCPCGRRSTRRRRRGGGAIGAFVDDLLREGMGDRDDGGGHAATRAWAIAVNAVRAGPPTVPSLRRR